MSCAEPWRWMKPVRLGKSALIALRLRDDEISFWANGVEENLQWGSEGFWMLSSSTFVGLKLLQEADWNQPAGLITS